MKLPNPSPYQVDKIMANLADRGELASVLWSAALLDRRPGLARLVRHLHDRGGDEQASIAIMAFWLIEECLEETDA